MIEEQPEGYEGEVAGIDLSMFVLILLSPNLAHGVSETSAAKPSLKKSLRPWPIMFASKSRRQR